MSSDRKGGYADILEDVARVMDGVCARLDRIGCGESSNCLKRVPQTTPKLHQRHLQPRTIKRRQAAMRIVHSENREG